MASDRATAVTDTAEMQLFRLHVRPDGDPDAAFAYCLKHGVLGTGWGTTRWGEPPSVPRAWPEYLAQARKIWTDRQFAPVRWFEAAPEGSLVWTRNPEGIYYLARFAAPWEYRDSQENRELDLNNVRPAQIVLVPGAEGGVPGAVVRAFSGRGWAFCRLWDDGARRYSEYLFASLTGGAPPSWVPEPLDIIDSLLDPYDVEDLVTAYLQATRGWIALPTRYSSSTIAYEYTLRDPQNGHVYAVQVKTGDAVVPVEQLSAEGNLKWVIFSARRRYPDKLPSHVAALEMDALIEFMLAQPFALPPVTSAWLSFGQLGPLKPTTN
jgi:hypothetical protein